MEIDFEKLAGKEDGERLARLAEIVETKLANASGCHDWGHTERVLKNAIAIAAEDSDGRNADMALVAAAALLHDIARPEEFESNGAVCHAELGSEIAPGVAREAGFDDSDFLERLSSCVLRHRYRGKHGPPATIEEKIVFDADKLDSLGAIGVARAIHFSGKIGSKLHNTEREALQSSAYGEGDSALREYLVKMRFIPDRMTTEAGKRLADERLEFTKVFFEQLDRETFV
jgi:uncharacterized protein